MYPMETDIKKNLETIYDRINGAALASGRSPQNIKLLGVTKQVDNQKIITALQAGLRSFGENYVQEFISKYDSLPDKYLKKIEWHFIGHLQKNKVKYIINRVNLIHSVDKLSLAQEIDKRAINLKKKCPVLVEVNLGGEDSKSGVPVEHLENLLDEISTLNNLEVTGLMAIPPFFDNPERARPYFIKLRELRDIFSISYNSLKELSMGMSGDYEVAIQEGATIVRIGTAIFGQRPV